MSEHDEDPFKIFANTEAPREEDLDRSAPPSYTETVGENGEVIIQVTPTLYARQFAAAMAGTFRALQDTREFNREEALQVLLQSMQAVVVHAHPDEDDDEDD